MTKTTRARYTLEFAVTVRSGLLKICRFQTAVALPNTWTGFLGTSRAVSATGSSSGCCFPLMYM